MSVSWWRFGVLALAGLAVLVPPASAQRFNGRGSAIGPIPFSYSGGINPNFYIAPGLTLNQAAYNTAIAGRAIRQIPPYAFGYNPYPQSVNYGPSFPSIAPAYNPALSTAPGAFGANPYTGGAALATNAGYSLSTTPGGYGGGYGGGGGYGDGYGSSPYAYGGGDTAGGYLRGQADVTVATGQFFKDVQTARLTREQSRVAALDTQRKRILDEAMYERMRPTAQNLRDAELATALNRARRDPPPTEITSGVALNELFRSIVGPGRANRGPNIPLEDDTVRSINLTDPTSRGNTGMLKDLKKADDVKWPLPFHEAAFDETRKRLSRNLVLAAQQVRDRDPLDPKSLKDLRADYNAMSDQLAANVGEMPPSQYIEARRYLQQVDSSLRALEDPNVGKLLSPSWVAKGKNIAELVDFMKNQGLRFAPAAPGEEGAYMALYYNLRNYENAVQTAAAK